MLSPSIGIDISSFKGVLKWKIRASFSKSGAKRKRHVFLSRSVWEDFHLLWNNFNLNDYDMAYHTCSA